MSQSNKRTHWKELFDSQCLNAGDFAHGSKTVTIVNVRAGSPPSSPKKKKPIIKLKEFDREWVCNATNARILVARFGFATEGWVGKQITLYRQTKVKNPQTGRNDAEGIRIKE